MPSAAIARRSVVLPAEWSPQAGVMLTWPHRYGDWGRDLAAAEATFACIAEAIAGYEPLVIVCRDSGHYRHVAEGLTARDIDMGAVCFFIAPSNDVWARDHGPLIVYEAGGQPVILDFTFNGWGGKYEAELDNQLTGRLVAAGIFGCAGYRRIDWILEGGSIDSDGEGSLLTTRSCLLSATRNPEFSVSEIEEQLLTRLGAQRVLWLGRGALDGDDTDGHIDMLARFCAVDTIAYTECDDPEDSHYAELGAMADELRALRTAQDQPYRLVPLPWPKPKRDPSGNRMPASYANFLVINGAVLVPQYDDAADADACERLQSCFPDRNIIGIPALTLIAEHGSVHCATMNIPAGVSLRGLGLCTSAA